MSVAEANANNLEEIETVFSIIKAQFPNASDKIKTKEFLDAAESAVTIVERFGKVFSPVTYDMNSNIHKLRQKYETDREKHKYLEEMILKEQTEGDICAADALIWLRRGLHFLSNFYQSIIDDTLSDRCTSDLAPFLKRAYVETLEQYHGWLGLQLFNVLSRFAPNRRQLIYTLSLDKHNRELNVITDMQVYTQRMMACVRRLTDFYVEYGLESFTAV